MDNVFKSYPGNYAYYKSVKDEIRQQDTKELVVKREKVEITRNIDESKKTQSEKTKALARVEILENEIKDIDLAMADQEIDYEELNKLYSIKENLSKDMDQVMELWLSFNN